MRAKTAEKVADVLGLVEVFLTTTQRPRKRPGCDRPLAEIKDGRGSKPLYHLTKNTSFFDLERVSLRGAVRLACIEQGYSRHVREAAEYEIRWQYFTHFGKYLSMEEIDNNERDSRELVRAVRRGRRFVEKLV